MSLGLHRRLNRARFHIGIDGGGSGTRSRLTDATGSVLGEGRAGPSALGQGPAEAARQVRAAIDHAFAAAGLAPAAAGDCALGLGLSGAENRGWLREFETALHAAAPTGWAATVLASDARTALLGALGSGAGTLIVLGTGSIGLGRDASGHERMAGGWGWRLGDEGSGAWLGQQAVRRAQQVLDGRAPTGPLAEAVLAHCGASRTALLDWCAEAGQATFAALAPLVLAQAIHDPQARRLVEDALSAAQDLADALDPGAERPLVISGTLGRQLEPRLRDRLRQRVVDAAGDALDGALQLLADPPSA